MLLVNSNMNANLTANSMRLNSEHQTMVVKAFILLYRADPTASCSVDIQTRRPTARAQEVPFPLRLLETDCK